MNVTEINKSMAWSQIHAHTTIAYSLPGKMSWESYIYSFGDPTVEGTWKWGKWRAILGINCGCWYNIILLHSIIDQHCVTSLRFRSCESINILCIHIVKFLNSKFFKKVFEFIIPHYAFNQTYLNIAVLH